MPALIEHSVTFTISRDDEGNHKMGVVFNPTLIHPKDDIYADMPADVKEIQGVVASIGHQVLETIKRMYDINGRKLDG